MADAKQEKVAAGLSKLLADTYAVYLKTHGYHWNVRGPNFSSLHSLFMTHYTEMWAAIDVIAGAGRPGASGLRRLRQALRHQGRRSDQVGRRHAEGAARRP